MLPEQRKEKVQDLIDEADKLWEDREYQANETNYNMAIEKYQQALWVLKELKPERFDPEWRNLYKDVENKLPNRQAGKERFLRVLRDKFHAAYNNKKREKAMHKIRQILILIGDTNSPLYIRFKIYRDYLYKEQ